ncbi:enolase [Encephalitozoon intestinalis ATCC 50506]|uniref:phosphopyruvate hydratase n=1 Tax=Encephalitozoon intestinalis (strain ATCC 50506) TaxID=876142 RepID=E0S9V5_ENCIT|nr:enolase [Encephalitozoon intestinalis ATCC 50506]ADM12490.1 enolase [Encephalitozoon intestinalis ATCC 50506]UTX46327.1 enolase [Encephalitozoon intestinalis]
MKVKDALEEIKPRMILTSRGHPTIEVDLITSKGVYRSSCPSGASRGSKEAVVVSDGGKSYNGRGVKTVINNINEVATKSIFELECPVDDLQGIDDCLLKLDGTKDKSRIGGNGIIALSTAFCKMGAAYSNRRVDEFLSDIGMFKRKIPIPHFNVLNGGIHSGNKMDVQEIMVVYQYDDLEKNIESGCVFYESLKKTISERYGALYTSVGDEGGFAPPIEKLEEGLELVLEASRRCKRTEMKIAIDFAANEFLRDGKYHLDGEVYTTRDLGEKYMRILREYPQIYSLEDPFSEEDYDGWTWINSEVGNKINIVGDDLTVTNPQLVENAGIRKMCNTLLVKPNQIGTVSETINAIKVARRHGMKIMVSHRSGETEDHFISDLSVGVGAEYIKSGAPCRGERVSKYNQLLRLNEY